MTFDTTSQELQQLITHDNVNDWRFRLFFTFHWIKLKIPTSSPPKTYHNPKHITAKNISQPTCVLQNTESSDDSRQGVVLLEAADPQPSAAAAGFYQTLPGNKVLSDNNNLTTRQQGLPDKNVYQTTRSTRQQDLPDNKIYQTTRFTRQRQSDNNNRDFLFLSEHGSSWC